MKVPTTHRCANHEHTAIMLFTQRLADAIRDGRTLYRCRSSCALAFRNSKVSYFSHENITKSFPYNPRLSSSPSHFGNLNVQAEYSATISGNYFRPEAILLPAIRSRDGILPVVFLSVVGEKERGGRERRSESSANARRPICILQKLKRKIVLRYNATAPPV